MSELTPARAPTHWSCFTLWNQCCCKAFESVWWNPSQVHWLSNMTHTWTLFSRKEGRKESLPLYLSSVSSGLKDLGVRNGCCDNETWWMMSGVHERLVKGKNYICLPRGRSHNQGKSNTLVFPWALVNDWGHKSWLHSLASGCESHYPCTFGSHVGCSRLVRRPSLWGLDAYILLSSSSSNHQETYKKLEFYFFFFLVCRIFFAEPVIN